jgi:Zn-dependent metalloprotease
MEERKVRSRVSIDWLRAPVATCGACAGVAVLAIGVALIAMTAVILLLGALGVDPAQVTLASAAQDAVVAFYVAQLVGVSFFNHTAELRFAAVPGLLLIGLSVVAATAVAVRAMSGSVRRKMTVALAMPIPYALLIGLAGLFAPLHFTAPGLGASIAVSPSPVEAFLLPFGWGLLFASVGGLIGAFGSEWRRAATRLLGAWAVPLAFSLRVLAASLVAGTAVVLVGGLAISGGDPGSLAGVGLGNPSAVLGTAIVALPTLAAAVLVSGFGVPFDWQVDSLSHGEGSISAFGGTLPTSGADLSQAQGAPMALALAPLIAIAAVFALGWLSARRSGSDARLGLANAVRAATLVTFAIWLLALLAQVDARAGGLLGFHLAPDAGVLLWRVPLVAFLGCLTGSLVCLLMREPSSRRHLATILVDTVRPSRWGPDGPSRTGRMSQGMTWRTALGVGFVSLPVALVGVGATGTATSAGPAEVSLAPISRAAEQVLERDSMQDESVSVTVDTETHVPSSASVHTPLRALGIAPGKSREAKAEDVIERYGELFGLSDPAAELGNAEAYIDDLGVVHVSFTQMANGVPVFTGEIRVHLSHKGELLTFVSGSIIPDVSVAEDKGKLSSKGAVEVARKALPAGRLAQPAGLQVYAGLPPYISGPDARLAWFVWLIDDANHRSAEYVVDAVTGQILDIIPKTHHVLERKVYDWGEGPKLPGELVREGNEPTEDPDTDNAYDHMGDAHAYIQATTERDSYDNNEGVLKATVHFRQPSGEPYEDSFWNGEQLVFGEGFPAALDIVGHELGHAYTEHSSGLVGEGVSGALSESFSDFMGVAMEMEKTEEVAWEVGEELPNGAIRSISEPGAYSALAEPEEELPHPDHLSNWVESCLDNFGVHINSTITSHAFYLAATNLSVAIEIPIGEATWTVAGLFGRGWMQYLTPRASFEDARAATLAVAAEKFTEEEPAQPAAYEAVEEAFDEVGIDGESQPPPASECNPCPFAQALKVQEGENEASALSMLTTLYEARGELALPSAAGKHFLPLYEEHMGRISELVSQDPRLGEMAVVGLAEVTPALDGLMEDEGEEFGLSKGRMAQIEAALKRLARDDRLFSGENAGELAELIEAELKWLNLPSYRGMDYEGGWKRLNDEVEAQMMLEEGGEIVDPNCTGPYPNNFHINSLYVEAPGHRIPGQVSPLNAGGIICGALVEETEGKSGCLGEGSLNTETAVQLPPGSDVNPSENLPNGSWVGEATGRVIICAGDETQILYGQARLLSLASWSAFQCPEAAIACYKGMTKFEGFTGIGYGWVSEGEGGALTLTTAPVSVMAEGYEVQVSFGQFEVKLCARAGNAEAMECGGPTAPWIHRNGEASKAGCPEGKGRYFMWARNAAEEETVPASACVRWDEGGQMQTVGAPDSLNAVSCVPVTTSCVAADSEGDAFYATNVSASSPASWNSWNGPGPSPSHAVECPSATLCLLAAGSVSGGGGNLYRTSSLGGSFSTAFSPTNGVGAISCPSTSFCVAALEGGGFIRYSTNPSGVIWKAVAIGSGAMKDVSCLSASFCAVVDAAGNVRVATTEAVVKEEGWTATNVNGATALVAVACSSTTSCVALDGTDEVLNLTIEHPSGKAKAERQALQGADNLTEVTCTGSSCVAVDDEGGVFASSNGGASWQKRLATAGNVTSVSCASTELCASVDTSGDVATFNPK